MNFLRLYFTPHEVQSLCRQHVEGLSLSMDTSRDEILRHVEELFYFQAGGEGRIRYEAFTSRIESLRKLGEMRWARSFGDRPLNLETQQASEYIRCGAEFRG